MTGPILTQSEIDALLGYPVRVQLKRTKGWRIPPNTVNVARPTKWGNQWKVGIIVCGCRSVGECDHNRFRCETAAEAVNAYRQLRCFDGSKTMREVHELRGKNLACWCALDQPCHADVLLEIANA